MSEKELKTIDLFSGCGGMSLGFQNAGFDIVAAYDNWDPAIDVYKLNFNHPIHKKDISDKAVIKEICETTPDVIIGGPPCQDFSTAGHRNEKLGRAILTSSYTEIIKNALPRIFVMENVPRIQKSNIYNEAIACFRESGYGLTQITLDASYCGVPQTRKRHIVIGMLHEKDGFLENLIEENLATSPLTMREYFGDKLEVDYYFRIPRSYNRRAVFSVNEPSITIRGVDRPIPPNYKKHPNDLVEIGPKVRALTVLERSYVQTFPESFKFEGTKTNLNQMIGNAVPVKMAEFIAINIIRYIKQRGGEN